MRLMDDERDFSRVREREKREGKKDTERISSSPLRMHVSVQESEGERRRGSPPHACGYF